MIEKCEQPPKHIAEYSEWLSNFQGCEMDDEIEIPGITKHSPLLYCFTCLFCNL